jgi:cysteine-rich repeat protein
VDAGEDCDDGDDNNSDTEPDACRTDCTEARCGDGVTDAGEACDDGNDIDDDGCSNACALPVVNLCEGVTCSDAPPADCASSSGVRTYSAPGTCSGSSGTPVCSYPSTVTACNTPPAPQCATNTSVRTFAATGTCGGSPASCTYAPTVTPCNTPPLASCAGNTLTTYAATGTCGGSPASCTYSRTTTTCTAGQVCDATAGACVAPPPEVCDNGTDDDGDGDTDCDDSDCATFYTCRTFDIGYCKLQHPPTINGFTGDTAQVFGRVYIAGLTDQTPLNNTHPNVIAQFGFGPDGSNPAASPSGWTWANASPTLGYDGIAAGEQDNDEYTYAWTLPAPGAYDYAYRFSGDGGTTWTLCDLQPVGVPGGSANGYSPADAGQATVTPPPVLGVVASWNIGVIGSETLATTGGDPINAGKLLSTMGGTSTIGYVAGFSPVPDRSASANTWTAGIDTKAWRVEVNTTGYTDLVLTTSRHYSSNTGPRDFQLQYSLDGSAWVDVPGGTFAVAPGTTWVTLSNIPLPAALNNRASSFLRWVVKSDISSNNPNQNLASGGTNRIDDIVISGLR